MNKIQDLVCHNIVVAHSPEWSREILILLQLGKGTYDFVDINHVLHSMPKGLLGFESKGEAILTALNEGWDVQGYDSTEELVAQIHHNLGM